LSFLEVRCPELVVSEEDRGMTMKGWINGGSVAASQESSLE